MDAAVIVTRLRAAGCVLAEDEARLLVAEATSPADLASMVERRVAGLPLEQVLGWAEFCGLRIRMEPGVFVPRRRTEVMVDEAATLARGMRRRPLVVVDLCCGSGALGIALVAALRSESEPRTDSSPVELHAADIDPAAVRCARRNVAGYGGQVYQGDLYDPLPVTLRGRVDVLLANIPYVPTDAVDLLPPEARDHEPLLALDGGADGLDIARRVSASAARWLAPGGVLLIETSEQQAPKLLDAFARDRLSPRVANSADAGATVVIGRRQ